MAEYALAVSRPGGLLDERQRLRRLVCWPPQRPGLVASIGGEPRRRAADMGSGGFGGWGTQGV